MMATTTIGYEYASFVLRIILFGLACAVFGYLLCMLLKRADKREELKQERCTDEDDCGCWECERHRLRHEAQRKDELIKSLEEAVQSGEPALRIQQGDVVLPDVTRVRFMQVFGGSVHVGREVAISDLRMYGGAFSSPALFELGKGNDEESIG